MDHYYDFFIDHVKVREIVTSMSCIDRAQTSEILSMHKEKGLKTAAIYFMEILKDCPEEGKYQVRILTIKSRRYFF